VRRYSFVGWDGQICPLTLMPSSFLILVSVMFAIADKARDLDHEAHPAPKRHPDVRGTPFFQALILYGKSFENEFEVSATLN
jgi:hypothetical protein